MRKIIDIDKLKMIIETGLSYSTEIAECPELYKFKNFLYAVMEVEGEKVETIKADYLVDKEELLRGGQDLVNQLNRSLYQKIGNYLSDNDIGAIHTHTEDWSGTYYDKTELYIEVVNSHKVST